MKALSLVFSIGLLVALADCTTPKVDLRVTGNKTACVVELRNLLLKGVPVVDELEIYRGGPPTPGKASECRLKASSDPLPLSKWQVGAEPTGFRLERCAPLDNGQRYTVSADTVGGLGARPFAIRADGTVDDLGFEWK